MPLYDPINCPSRFLACINHTKLNKRKPLSFYVLCFCAVIVSVISYRIYQRINEFSNPATSVPVVSESQPITSVTSATATQGAGAGGAFVDTSINSQTDFKPVQPGHPETAPAYAHLLKVTAVPVLAGCISSKTSCKCYTHQGTPYPVAWKQCQEHILNLHFNPYLNPPAIQTTEKTTLPEPALKKPIFPISNLPSDIQPDTG
jgi:zona occludens toxin